MSYLKTYVNKKILKEFNAGEVAATAAIGSAVAPVAAAIGAGALSMGQKISNIYKGIKYSMVDCDKLTDPRQIEECKQKIKRKEAQKKISELIKLKSKCAKEKNPQECNDMIQQKISAEQQNLY